MEQKLQTQDKTIILTEENFAEEDVQKLWPVIHNLIDIDGSAEQMMEKLAEQSEELLQLQNNSIAINSNVGEGVIILTKVLRDKSNWQTTAVTLSSVGVGVGVGVLVGIVGGPIGMVVGGIVGGTVFGVTGNLSSRVISKTMKTNSQKALMATIQENWENWKTNQTCFQCDKLIKKKINVIIVDIVVLFSVWIVLQTKLQ